MVQGNYKTNPKNIIKLDSEHIHLSINRDDTSCISSFSFKGFSQDINSVYNFNSINKDASIILEIDDGKDLQRVELGSLKKPKLYDKHDYDIEGNLSNLTYNLFVVEGYVVKASCEKLIPADIQRGDERSLINVEAEDLGELAWKIEPYDGQSEPILKVNNNPEMEMQKLLESDYGRLLIFQNAFEQILRILIKSDEESEWVKNWQIFFDNENIEHPNHGDEKFDIEDWIYETVSKMSKKWNLLTKYKNYKTGV